MDVTIRPSLLEGNIMAPPSKSYTHRAILAAGHSQLTKIENPLLSADTRATIRAIEALGSTVIEKGELIVTGFNNRPCAPSNTIDCANSGTTMRLLIATAALVNGTTTLTGDESLKSRPQGELLSAIAQLGGKANSIQNKGRAPLTIKGPINGGSVSVPGDVSSQFITSLLMAGGVTEDGIDITLLSDLKSKPYVDITIEVLNSFGIETQTTENGYYVPGRQSYSSPKPTYKVPGDFSSISYLLAAGALASDNGIMVNGAQLTSQGDAAIVDILSNMGADVHWDTANETISITKSPLFGITVDVGNTPDLLPTISILAAAADGKTTIENCSHVRYKETDRVSAMSEELQKLGVKTKEYSDKLIINGSPSLIGANLNGRGDHRIIMSLSLLGLITPGGLQISGAEHVAVSYPDFFQVLKNLGAEIEGDQ